MLRADLCIVPILCWKWILPAQNVPSLLSSWILFIYLFMVKQPFYMMLNVKTVGYSGETTSPGETRHPLLSNSWWLQRFHMNTCAVSLWFGLCFFSLRFICWNSCLIIKMFSCPQFTSLIKISLRFIVCIVEFRPGYLLSLWLYNKLTFTSPHQVSGQRVFTGNQMHQSQKTCSLRCVPWHCSKTKKQWRSPAGKTMVVILLLPCQNVLSTKTLRKEK